MKTGDNPDIPNRISLRIVCILLATVIASVFLTFIGAQRLFEAQAISVAQSQHALYLRSLNEALKKHQHLPFILGENTALSRNAEPSETSNLNAILSEFANASGLEAIYVMSLDGEVIAASNYQLESSFVGQNYGFRPYFQGAADGKRSDYFAIGATTGRPGYFVAEPLRSPSGDVAGVVAIKLDVSELQASWEERGEQVLATNSDGIVVLSSNPEWLYRSLFDIDPKRKAEIFHSRQFGREALSPLAWVLGAEGQVVFTDQSYYIVSGTTEIVDWNVHYLSSVGAVTRQTLLTTSILGLSIAVLIGFSAFLRSRRIQAALDVSQRQRLELVEINAKLMKTQEDLARTSKMAALGQLAASVTHELGQPISALKNHLVAAEIGNEITSPQTLKSLHMLAERMEATTKQLRFFARKRREEWEPCNMISVVDEAIALMQHDLEAACVNLNWTPPSKACLVEGDQLQLEQAMTNLLRNALNASRENETPCIKIRCRNTAQHIEVYVEDNGAGLLGQDLDTLQEPFFSTRSSGDGMGLGLAITAEIIRAHSGRLNAGDAPKGGAIFQVTLPTRRTA